MSNLLTRYIRNSSWVLMGNVVSRGFSLLASVFIARLLGPSSFGSYNIALASSDSFSQMADLGTSVVVQRTYATYQTNKPALTGNSFSGSIWLFVFFYTALYLVLFTADKFSLLANLLPVNSSVLMILFISFTARLNQFILVPLTGFQEFKKYSYRTVLNAGLVLLTVGVGAWWLQLPGALYGILLANCLSMLITGVWVYKEHQYRAIPVHWLGGLRAMPSLLKQGFLLYAGNTLSGAIYNLVLVGLVIQHIPVAEYGYLRIGLSLASIVGIFVAALQPVTLSALADQNNHTQHAQLKSVTIRVVFCLVLLCTLWLITFNDLLVALLFGKLYLNGLFIIAAMLMITSIQVLNQFFVSFLIAKGFGNFIGVMAIGTVTLSILLAYWLIPIFGITGYLISYGAGYSAGLFIAFWKEVTTTVYQDQAKLIGVFLFTILVLTAAYLSVQVVGPMVRLVLCSTLTIFFGGSWYFLILHATERNLIAVTLYKFRN